MRVLYLRYKNFNNKYLDCYNREFNIGSYKFARNNTTIKRTLRRYIRENPYTIRHRYSKKEKFSDICYHNYRGLRSHYELGLIKKHTLNSYYHKSPVFYKMFFNAFEIVTGNYG